MGPTRSRLRGPGGMARHWHAGHSERASMFSPYMMLHVLFFLDLMQDSHFTLVLLICQYYECWNIMFKIVKH